MKKLLYISFFSLLLITSCDNKQVKGPYIDSSKLKPVDITIHRYGKALFNIDTNNFQSELTNIHDEFVLFLGNDISDSQKTQPLYKYITDTAIIQVANAVESEYPDLVDLESNLEDAFSRFKYFFPKKQIPEVYTYVSNLYFEKPVIYDQDIVIIGLDLYLGPEFQKYRTLGIPYYIIRRMTSEKIPVDVMSIIYDEELKKGYDQKNLISEIIEKGKKLYYLDAMLPNTPDSIKIGYTSKQINWIENNRKNLWAFLVNNDLFYSADFKTIKNFTNDGPFTSSFSNESPPMTGTWLGWQIVRKYMYEHPDVTLAQLINEKDYQKIFNRSGYKP